MMSDNCPSCTKHVPPDFSSPLSVISGITYRTTQFYSLLTTDLANALTSHKSDTNKPSTDFVAHPEFSLIPYKIFKFPNFQVFKISCHLHK